MFYLTSLLSVISISFPMNMLDSFNMNTSILSLSMVWLVCGGVIISATSSQANNYLWSIFSLVLLFSFLTKTLLSFYILFELSLIPILLMIIYWGNQPERLSAGLYLILYTGFFSIPFMVIVLKLLQQSSFYWFFSLGSSLIVSLLVLSPFLVKMPILGLHFWLPKAHVEASTSGSMILAGVLLKLGSYGAARVISLFSITFWKSISLWLIFSIVSSILTCLQSDIKKLVAYSSVTHMTFSMVGLLSSSKILLMSIVLISLAHGWAAMGLFLSAGIMSGSTSSRLSFSMGTEYKFHWFVLTLGVLLMSNASLPPFPSFFPEVLMVSMLSFKTAIPLFTILSLVVCYYNVYLYTLMLHFGAYETKMSSLSISEFFKTFSLSLLPLTSLGWILFF